MLQNELRPGASIRISGVHNGWMKYRRHDDTHVWCTSHSRFNLQSGAFFLGLDDTEPNPEPETRNHKFKLYKLLVVKYDLPDGGRIEYERGYTVYLDEWSKYHRLDGPAIISTSLTQDPKYRYMIHGEEMNESEFNFWRKCHANVE